ncbi:hypothetical protein PTSG_10957 [Salpingoeca rosetta]|uniref:AAA+ ATPase domain-containing protein n=1 Tax=Salpingoeca rosetta (strain ATCC 50818 / BSB-021) TaxID=946362 RepID=F2USA5_SALR5|nr:uncharacterized protein PTSG_10957 [Salpingoeca rosetta]EGD81014.1 hypothetical protein PTSG_10957 [Salpingoeca rosetta]|eukprot:XP_004987884.1 hypothetical protein PTSG_10957 [Salpingoeca rosetta]
MAMTSAARRHILITGSPGTGKSTLVSKLIARFKDKGVPMQGFWTKEVRQGGNRIGFDVVTLDGKEGVLSRVGAKGPRVGKYGVNVKEFEELALPCLRAGPVQKQEQGGEEAGQQGRQRQAVRLVVVDEIGKMELFSQPFMTAYKGLLDSAADRGVVVVSTIAKRGQGFIAEVKSRPDVDLHEITRANRDAKFEELASTLLRQLRPSS